MSQSNHKLSEDVRERSIQARMNIKYHGQLERRFARLDSFSKIISAIFGASAVASMFTEAIVLWKVLTATVAIVTTIAASLDWGKTSRLHAGIRQEWIMLTGQWERLHRVMTRLPPLEKATDVNQERFEELVSEEERVSRREPAVPDRELLKACLAEVVEEDSVKDPEQRPKLTAA